MSMIAAAVGVGAAASIYGTIKSSAAAQDAAVSQGKIAVEQEVRANQAMGFAAPTAGELQTLGNQITNYEQAHAQAQSTLSTIGQQLQKTYGDNILELGNQLHQQLTGSDSGVVASAKTQIDRQRQQLQQSLIDKMGPGALTSTAGVQALNNFDLQSTNYMSNLRQNSIGVITQNLSSLQGGESSAISSINSVNGNISAMLNQIQSTQSGFQTRQANAAIGSAQYQGGENVEALQSAKASAETGKQIASLGGSVIGAGVGAAAKAASAATTAANQIQPGAITQNGFTAQDLSGGGQGSSGYTGADLGAGTNPATGAANRGTQFGNEIA